MLEKLSCSFPLAAYGLLLLTVIAASGFVMMFAPESAKRLLKNAAVSLALFALGWLLLNYFFAAVRHTAR